MSNEAFDRMVKGILGLEVIDCGVDANQSPTPALDVITCVRYWKWKPTIPLRLRAILNDGKALLCQFRDELMLWRAVKNRGFLDNVRQLVPPELVNKLC